MRKLKNISAFLLLFLSINASGSDSLNRFSFIAGLGQSTVQSAEEGGGTRSEGPVGFGFILDYTGNQSYTVFAEHLRSSRLVETAVGLIGGGIKYYPWLNPKHIAMPAEINRIDKNLIHYIGFAPYFGGSLGFFQASFPETDEFDSVIAAGFYSSVKAGADYPMSSKWGFRVESSFVTTIFGAGTVNFFDIVGGAYILL